MLVRLMQAFAEMVTFVNQYCRLRVDLFPYGVKGGTLVEQSQSLTEQSLFKMQVAMLIFICNRIVQ